MADNDNIMEYDELDNTLIMQDEEGNEVTFEFLDYIEYEGGEYVVLLPLDEDEEGMREVVILAVCSETDEEQSFEWIEDEKVRNALFEIFKERFKDDFNFTE